MSNIEPIAKYDANGKLIYFRHREGYDYEEWWEYDSHGNCIHYWDSNGEETWYEYDSDGKLIHSRDSDGYEVWYDSEGNEYKNQEKAIRANTMINLNTQIKQMCLDDLIVLENLIKDRFIQHYNEVSEKIRKEQ